MAPAIRAADSLKVRIKSAFPYPRELNSDKTSRDSHGHWGPSARSISHATQSTSGHQKFPAAAADAASRGLKPFQLSIRTDWEEDRMTREEHRVLGSKGTTRAFAANGQQQQRQRQATFGFAGASINGKN
jgi:hypothetical protein